MNDTWELRKKASYFCTVPCAMKSAADSAGKAALPHKRFICRTDLIRKTDDHRGTALWNREQCQGPHMASDDILFHRRELIPLHGIFQSHCRMMEPMQPFMGSAVVPVVEIKIMEKRAPYQLAVRCAQMKTAVQVKAEPGHAEHMLIGGDLPMLDKMLHKLGFFCQIQPVKMISDFGYLSFCQSHLESCPSVFFLWKESACFILLPSSLYLAWRKDTEERSARV